MDLENLKLSKISQPQKGKPCLASLMRRLKVEAVQADNRIVVSRGWADDVKNYLMCIGKAV